MVTGAHSAEQEHTAAWTTIMPGTRLFVAAWLLGFAGNGAVFRASPELPPGHWYSVPMLWLSTRAPYLR